MVPGFHASWCIWHAKGYAEIRVSHFYNFAVAFVMSEPLRDLVASDGNNKEGPNYFGLYTHEVAKLLSEDEGLEPFSFQSSELSREVRDTDMPKHINTGETANSFTNAGSLFSNAMGVGLSDFKKERLKRLLRQGATILTQEVDEMLDPVVATRRLLFQLSDRKRPLTDSGVASDGDAGKLPLKKVKMSSSSCSSGVPVCASQANSGSCREDVGPENMKSKFSDAIASEKKESHAVQRSCSRCCTLITPKWRTGPDGAELCNACGIKHMKEKKSLVAKNEEMGSLLGSHVGNDTGKEEVTDDLKFLLENDRSQVEQTMKKYSGELCTTLEHMEQQLEELLNTVMAKCRPMVLSEKQRLRNMIQNLPPENLDRVMEIIRHGKPLDNENENFVDLEEEDNSTLWRLYYYVEAVVNARKLSM